jgi:AcrR family transcriptional regulator
VRISSETRDRAGGASAVDGGIAGLFLYQLHQVRHMPRIKLQTSENRRNEILEAAETCFSKQGFHQTTIQHVVRESRLSAGCIYSYFASKEDLVRAIGERRHALDLSLLQQAAESDSPLLQIRLIAQRFVENLATRNGLQARRIGLQLWAEALRDPEVKKQVVAGIRAPVGVISSLLQEAKKQQLIQADVDPEMTARSLVALFQGYVLQRIWGEPIDSTSALTFLDATLHGLKSRS